MTPIFTKKILTESKPDVVNGNDWAFRRQARNTRVMELKANCGSYYGVRLKQIITGFPFCVKDWTVKDAYKGTGYWFESWPVVQKVKKKGRRKKSSSRSRAESTRSGHDYKSKVVGFHNLLVIQMVNEEKFYGNKKKTPKKKTATVKKHIFLSSSDSDSSSSSSDSSSDTSISSKSTRGGGNRRYGRGNRRRAAPSADDEGISYGMADDDEEMMSTGDGNARSSFETAVFPSPTMNNDY